jgi:hypothetical protein
VLIMFDDDNDDGEVTEQQIDIFIITFSRKHPDEKIPSRRSMRQMLSRHIKRQHRINLKKDTVFRVEDTVL